MAGLLGILEYITKKIARLGDFQRIDFFLLGYFVWKERRRRRIKSTTQRLLESTTIAFSYTVDPGCDYGVCGGAQLWLSLPGIITELRE